MSNKKTYEFHYFPIHALGATSRAILSLAGANWRDRLQSFETWKDDKLKTPFGSLPILTVQDANGEILHKIPEADVIERFLAKELGFMGSNAEEEIQISIALSQTITIYNVWVFRVVPALEPVREQVMKAFLEISLKNWVKNLERLLQENGSNGHLVGNKASLADIKTAVVLDMFLAVGPSEEVLNKEIAPELWKLKEMIDSDPGYGTYRQSEAFKLQDEMTKKKVVPNMEFFDMTRAHIFI
ncbi:hypothetical protein BGX28_007438 [Mortierella sp. GBA30]|nr:hypothetical protein BGX28_007438 [Mortierella sp. GBA30]